MMEEVQRHVFWDVNLVQCLWSKISDFFRGFHLHFTLCLCCCSQIWACSSISSLFYFVPQSRLFFISCYCLRPWRQPLSFPGVGGYQGSCCRESKHAEPDFVFSVGLRFRSQIHFPSPCFGSASLISFSVRWSFSVPDVALADVFILRSIFVFCSHAQIFLLRQVGLGFPAQDLLPLIDFKSRGPGFHLPRWVLVPRPWFRFSRTGLSPAVCCPFSSRCLSSFCSWFSPQVQLAPPCSCRFGFGGASACLALCIPARRFQNRGWIFWLRPCWASLIQIWIEMDCSLFYVLIHI